MKKGQYISLDVTQSIDGQPPLTMLQRLDEILERTETSERIDWQFHVTQNQLVDSSGTWKQTKDVYDIGMEKDPSTAIAAISGTALSVTDKKMNIYSLKGLQAEDEQSPTKVTYHNLKREDGYMPVPLLVKNHQDGKCGGVQNCDKGLRYVRVSFDRVIWDRPDKGIKTAFTFTYSADIPTYIADWDSPSSMAPSNQIQSCAKTWMEIESGSMTQVIPIQQCADIRDFQHGSTTSP